MTPRELTCDETLAEMARVLTVEAAALTQMASEVGDPQLKAVEILEAMEGRVIVSGVGKSGHIGNKIAATLASTGTPAQFVHATEASHGDLGMITAADVVLAIGTELGETDYDVVFDDGFVIGGQLIRIDIDPEQLARNQQATLAIVADAGLALETLAARVAGGLGETYDKTPDAETGSAGDESN